MRLNYSKLPARVNWDEFAEVSREIMGSEYSSSKALDYGAVLMECFRLIRLSNLSQICVGSPQAHIGTHSVGESGDTVEGSE